MENDPVYWDLPRMSKARDEKMPLSDDRANDWLVIPLIFMVVAIVGYLILVVFMVDGISKSIG